MPVEPFTSVSTKLLFRLVVCWGKHMLWQTTNSSQEKISTTTDERPWNQLSCPETTETVILWQDTSYYLFMPSWEVTTPGEGVVKSWRDKYPEMAEKVERITVPEGRGIPYEGAEIYRYKGTPKNIDFLLRERAREASDEEAYVFHPGGERLTWGEVDQRVRNVAYYLRHEHGFSEGDGLALMVPGSPAYIIGFLAAARLGGFAVPINLELANDSIKRQIQEVSAKCLVIDESIWTSDVRPMRDELETLETVLIAGDAVDEGTTAFSSISTEKAPEDVSTDVDEWDTLAINFTSGTTGDPKPFKVMHTNALGCSFAAEDVFNLESDDVMLCMAPLFHNTAVYANFIPSLLIGFKMVVMEEFVPSEANQLIEMEEVTGSVSAPVMYWFMMNDPSSEEYDLSTMSKFGYGGHAPSESFIEELEETFSPEVSVNAGSISENTALGIGRPTEDVKEKTMSLGLATPNTEIALFDEDGEEITEPNEVGEIAYKGQQTTKGYLNSPEKTKKAFRDDGYVLSGDFAEFDEDGYIYLLDRKKDMIARGGQNVYCVEVENVLYKHDGVLSAAVMGVPDHVFAERVKAIVRPKPGRELSPDEIREHCNQHLASYESPEYVVIMEDEIPTNPAGKTLKHELVDEWNTADDAENPALASLEAYMQSLPDDLRDKGMFKTAPNDDLITPEAARSDRKSESSAGDAIRDVIADQGIVGLLEP